MNNIIDRWHFRLGALIALTALLFAQNVFALGCPDWAEVTTERFKLYTSLRAAKATKIAEALNRFETAIEVVTNSRPAKGEPTTIVILEGDQWNLFIGKTFEGVFNPYMFENTILAVEPDARSANPYAVTMHEYVHYVLYSQGSFVYPSWYNEGLAEVLSAGKETDTTLQLGLLWRERLQNAKDSAAETTVRSILSNISTHTIHDRIRRAEFYGKSTLLAHYLLFSPKRNAQLIAYLKAVNRGESTDEAFAHTFDVSYDELEDELRDYARQKDYPGFTLPKTMLAPHEPPTTRSIPCAQGRLIAGKLLLRAGGAPDLVIREYFKDTDNGTPQASWRLARAEALFKMKDPEKANALIDEALRAPGLTGYEILSAVQLLLWHSKPRDDDDVTVSADDRSLLMRVKTLMADPKVREMKSAEAAFIIARVALILNEDLDEALEVAFKGLELAPKNPYLAETTALLCEIKKDPGNAAGAWSIVAAYSKDGETRLRAKRAMADIDRAARSKR